MLDFVTVGLILALLGAALAVSSDYREKYFSAPYSAFDSDYDNR